MDGVIVLNRETSAIVLPTAVARYVKMQNLCLYKNKKMHSIYKQKRNDHLYFNWNRMPQ